MRHHCDRYRPITLGIDIYRNAIVKRAVSYLNKMAESKYNGENMRYVNQLQPETDFCQDSMIVDGVLEDGIMRVIKRIEPYFEGFEREGGDGMEVVPEHIEFNWYGGTSSFAVTTASGDTLDVQPESLAFDWDGGTRTLLVKTGGGDVPDSDTRLNLVFPWNWKRQFDTVLKKRISEYLVMHVVAEWLEMVNLQEAEYYVRKAERLLQDVKGTCEMRQGRVHYGWNTTY